MPLPTTPNRYPNALEKKNQLERMLAARQFKKSPKLWELLKFLVESDLGRIPVDQYIVGIRVFDRREDWYPTDDNTVREGMRRLRILLESYYASDGIEDRLNLEFDQYKPVFSYNLRNPVERSLRLAARAIGNNPKTAFRHLDDVLSLEPDHAEALAGWAETELWRLFYGYDMGLPDFFEARELQVQQALESDPTCWRAHVVQGALWCWTQDWDRGADSFAGALRSSPEQTRAHPWYAGFLLATGKTRAAIDLVKARAGEPADSPWPQLTYAVFLYAARLNREALHVLREAVVDEQDRRFFDVMRYFALFAQEDFPSPHDRLHLGAMTEIHPETSEQWYPIFSFVCYAFILDPGYEEYKLVKGAIKDMGREKLAGWTRPPGFTGDPYGKPFLSPFQLAIGYLCIGDTERAIELLSVDLEAGHPFMAWLHLWPVFDPLRKEAGFQALIARLNLPRL